MIYARGLKTGGGRPSPARWIEQFCPRYWLDVAAAVAAGHQHLPVPWQGRRVSGAWNAEVASRRPLTGRLRWHRWTELRVSIVSRDRAAHGGQG
jgi:hypothetical protein